MTIINSKYNISNGNDYETYHFETNAKQVLLKNSDKTLEDVILGLDQDGQNLSIFKEQGLYLVSNSTDLPTGVDKTEKYLLEVKVVGDIVWQYLYEHKGNNVYVRSLTKLGFSKWALGGNDIQTFINNTETAIIEVVNYTRLLDERIEQVTDSMALVIEKISKSVTSHNHDERYVPKNGGAYTGEVQLTKASGIVGRHTNGQTFKIIKSNDNKVIELGNKDSVIDIKSPVVYIDGKRLIDIDEVGVIANSSVERGLAKQNTFTANQTISKSRLIINNSKGLTSSLGFNGGTGTNFTLEYDGKERIKVDSVNTVLTGGLIVDGTFAKIRSGSTDNGLGVVYASDKLTVTDFAKNKNYFLIERAGGEVQFTKNSIKLAGRRLSVSTTAPTNPTVGDIWIG